MNKKIKIIDLLNKIVNGEDLPEKIKWGTVNYILKQDSCDEHFYYEKEQGLASLVAELKTMDDLKSEVEILEDNTEEIEELFDYRTGENDLYNDNFDDMFRKINELVKVINSIRKDKNND